MVQNDADGRPAGHAAGDEDGTRSDDDDEDQDNFPTAA